GDCRGDRELSGRRWRQGGQHYVLGGADVVVDLEVNHVAGQVELGAIGQGDEGVAVRAEVVERAADGARARVFDNRERLAGRRHEAAEQRGNERGATQGDGAAGGNLVELRAGGGAADIGIERGAGG